MDISILFETRSIHLYVIKWFSPILFGLIFCLIACTSPQVAPVTSPASPTISSFTLTPTPRPVTPPFTPSPTPRPPTSTPQPSATPTPLPIPPTPFTLTGRTPNDLDVIRFVFNRRQPDIGALSIDGFYKELTTGEYKDFTRQDVDVNGDGQPEIIVSGSLVVSAYTAILAYFPGDTWREIFFVTESGWYCANAQAKTEKDRVVADFLTCWGGTGLLELILTQHWIQCSQDKCTDIWSVPIFSTSTGGNQTVSRSYSIPTIEQPDSKTIQLTTHDFTIADIPLTSGDFPVETPKRIIGPDIQEIYRWNGNIYQLESKRQISPGIEITGEFDAGTNETLISIDSILKQPFKRANDTYDNDKVLAARANFWGVSDTVDQDRVIWETGYYWP